MRPISRRCSNCRKKVPATEAFVSQFKAFCSYECLKEYTSKNVDKIRSRVMKEKRQQDRVIKEKLKAKRARREAKLKAGRAGRVGRNGVID